MVIRIITTIIMTMTMTAITLVARQRPDWRDHMPAAAPRDRKMTANEDLAAR
jgi:hypothetical protein